MGKGDLQLNDAIWRAESWDDYQFIRGKYDMLRRFNGERMKKEIQLMKEALRQNDKNA